MSALGTARRRVLGITSERKVFSQPGFAPEAWQRFHPVVESLALGYHAALEDGEHDALVPRLEAVDPALRGFAYEGAGMAFGALDLMAPWKRRLEDFVAGPGARHIYPIYIGVGLALGRSKVPPGRVMRRLDPVLRWVVVDGYGFSAGFFARRRYVDRQARSPLLTPYGNRVFDQGLGRALWFSCGAVVEQIAATVDAFPAGRRADLWSGVGTACAYGGGLDREGVQEVLRVAAPYRAQLARGAATAASGRVLAGNPTEHTDLACEVFCGMPSSKAAELIDEAKVDLPADSGVPAYEIWRRRTEQALLA